MRSCPQQRTAPFSRSPQAWVLPAVICVKATSAGGEVGGGVGVGVGIATLGDVVVAVGAGGGVGCAVGGGMAADGGAGVGLATLGGKGAGGGDGVAGRGGGDWEQANSARQIAAQRAAILGMFWFCHFLNKCAVGVVIAAMLSNLGDAPCLNWAGAIISKFVGGAQLWRARGGAAFL